MFEGFRHSYKVGLLQSELRQNAKRYGKIIALAKKESESESAIEGVYAEWSESDRIAEDEIWQLNSQFLRVYLKSPCRD
jgi:hypothetical protein